MVKNLYKYASLFIHFLKLGISSTNAILGKIVQDNKHITPPYCNARSELMYLEHSSCDQITQDTTAFLHLSLVEVIQE